MTQKVRAVRKVVQTVIGVDNPEAFAEMFYAALNKGELDSVLHVLWTTVDDRVRQYMQADGENLDEAFLKALHGLKNYYDAPELEIGAIYHLRGEKYVGISVELLGHMPEEVGKPERVRVKIAHTPQTVMKDGVRVGSMVQVPAGALLPIENKNPQTRRTSI